MMGRVERVNCRQDACGKGRYSPKVPEVIPKLEQQHLATNGVQRIKGNKELNDAN